MGGLSLATCPGLAKHGRMRLVASRDVGLPRWLRSMHVPGARGFLLEKGKGNQEMGNSLEVTCVSERQHFLR